VDCIAGVKRKNEKEKKKKKKRKRKKKKNEKIEDVIRKEEGRKEDKDYSKCLHRYHIKKCRYRSLRTPPMDIHQPSTQLINR